MPGHWRGRVRKINLFGSSYLPPDYVELTEPKRTIEPSFWEFQMRVRNATPTELPVLKQEAKKRFRAEGPFEMTICLSHKKRRKINAVSNVEGGLRIPCEDAAGGVLAAFLRVFGAGGDWKSPRSCCFFACFAGGAASAFFAFGAAFRDAGAGGDWKAPRFSFLAGGASPFVYPG